MRFAKIAFALLLCSQLALAQEAIDLDRDDQVLWSEGRSAPTSPVVANVELKATIDFDSTSGQPLKTGVEDLARLMNALNNTQAIVDLEIHTYPPKTPLPEDENAEHQKRVSWILQRLVDAYGEHNFPLRVIENYNSTNSCGRTSHPAQCVQVRVSARLIVDL